MTLDCICLGFLGLVIWGLSLMTALELSMVVTMVFRAYGLVGCFCYFFGPLWLLLTWQRDAICGSTSPLSAYVFLLFNPSASAYCLIHFD